MNTFNKETTHLVVHFMSHKKFDKDSEAIELVPCSWLKFTDKWMCYFPPKKDWNKVDKWTKISKKPDENWKTFEVLILKEAANYDQGMRRLKKAYTNSVISSTDCEEANDNSGIT
ncbi:PREDICTED: uncharacterized protein LOC108759158, partial [Trachymyrmex cornetzi]|uniref:uncharacterized protein LOC108759158 n=1 Tax=Trachymyrmex cornetzi TaxID=471704 RepID=UPI00084EE325